MLEKIGIGIMLFCTVGCTTLPNHEAEPISFDVAAAGDDGLTQRMVFGLRAELARLGDFRAATRSPDTLIIVIPNVQSQQVGGTSQARAEINFSKLGATEQLSIIKKIRVNCREDDLSKCFEQVAAAARKLRKQGIIA